MVAQNPTIYNNIPSTLVAITDIMQVTEAAWRVVDNNEIDATSGSAIEKQVDSAMAAIQRKIKKEVAEE